MEYLRWLEISFQSFLLLLPSPTIKLHANAFSNMTGEHKSDCLTEQKAWTLQIELCMFNNAFKSKLMCFSDSECKHLIHCSTSTFTNTFTNFTCWFMYMFFFLSYYFPSSQQREWLDRKLNGYSVTSSKRKMTPNESAALEALVHIVQNFCRAENNAELMANMLGRGPEFHWRCTFYIFISNFFHQI